MIFRTIWQSPHRPVLQDDDFFPLSDGAVTYHCTRAEILAGAARTNVSNTWTVVQNFLGGVTGPGTLPPGGNTSNFLVKISPLDYDVGWASTTPGDLPPGGVAGDILVKTGPNNIDVDWVTINTVLPPNLAYLDKANTFTVFNKFENDVRIDNNLSVGNFISVNEGVFTVNAAGDVLANDVTAAYFIGDGSKLTGLPIPPLPANIAYTDKANVFTASPQTVVGDITVRQPSGTVGVDETVLNNDGSNFVLRNYAQGNISFRNELGADTFRVGSLGQASVIAQTNGAIPLVLIGALNQVADLQQWRDQAVNVLASVHYDGSISTGGGKDWTDLTFNSKLADGGRVIRYESRVANVLLSAPDFQIGEMGNPSLTVAEGGTMVRRGQFFVGPNTTTFSVRVNPGINGLVALTVKSVAGQTADLVRVDSAVGGRLGGFNVGGDVIFGNGNFMWHDAGSGWTACTDPNNPTVARPIRALAFGAGSDEAHLGPNDLQCRAAFVIEWTAGLTHVGVKDVGLARDTAAVLKITDGDAGGLGVLRCQRISTPPSSPPLITSDLVDYNPPPSRFMRLATDASRTIHSMAPGHSGENRQLVNVGANPIVFPHESGSGTSTHRFLTMTGASVTLNANEGCGLVYDSVSLRWRIFK